MSLLYNFTFSFSFSVGQLAAAPTPVRRTDSQIQWVDCTKNVPAPIQASLNITEWDTTSLGPLPDTLTCGRMNVPLDYEQPLSDSNNITIAFSLYTPQNAVGTIFYNPGGPGVEAQSNAWLLATNKSQLFSGLEDHQFMMMDTRGTHASSPLNCSLEAYNAIPFGAPQDQTSFEDYQANDSIKHIGTQETVQDWERQKDRNLIGVSYGTYFFAEYVQRFPNSIERAALDAVTVRGKADIEAIKDEVTAVNRMLQRADAFCQSNSTCPFYVQGKGSVLEAWKQILQKAEAGQLVAQKCLDPAAGCSANITVEDIRQTVPGLLRSTPNYEILMQVMAGALLQNDASGLIVPVELDLGISAAVPLFCPDDNIDNNSLEGSKAIQEAIVPLDPNNFQASFIWQGKLDCSNWPVAGRPKVDLKSVSNFPFLWVTSDFDLNTPTEWASFNHDQTPNSTLVVRHGDGHGSIFVLGPARDAIIEYMRTGKVLPSSNETLATVFPPGTSRDILILLGLVRSKGDVGVLV
ncbi:hypothetical protein DL96DRAFT_1549699 [Flagelloscypha sp. PMI_526]|nr:hypothetical protein DL96DRAFT_1549699 [Flagelloscypha sp. PMI_526]